MTSLMKLTTAVRLAVSEAVKLESANNANDQHSHKGSAVLPSMLGVLKATIKVIRQPALC
jgi:hypothetical protein